MRRALWVVATVFAVCGWSTEGRAQTTGAFDDPFFAYYSFYLPYQAARAAQPRVEDTINQNFADNQLAARTNRAAGLYDPNGGYGAFDNYDPNASFEKVNNAGSRYSNNGRHQFRGLPTTNINGRGPGLFYNRAAGFYPSLRSGVGPNRNLAVTGRGIRGGGGRGVPSAGGGMGGGPLRPSDGRGIHSRYNATSVAGFTPASDVLD